MNISAKSAEKICTQPETSPMGKYKQKSLCLSLLVNSAFASHGGCFLCSTTRLPRSVPCGDCESGPRFPRPAQVFRQRSIPFRLPFVISSAKYLVF